MFKEYVRKKERLKKWKKRTKECYKIKLLDILRELQAL